MNHLPRPKFLRKKSMKMSSAAVVIGTLEKVQKIIHMSRFNDFVIIQYIYVVHTGIASLKQYEEHQRLISVLVQK